MLAISRNEVIDALPHERVPIALPRSHTIKRTIESLAILAYSSRKKAHGHHCMQ